MIVMRVSTRVVIVLALAAVLVGSGGRSGHASAPGARSSPPLSAGCPAETVRNSALGVTLTLPPGWRDYGFNLSAPGGLFVADPAVHNGKGYPLGIGIGPLGTTSDHDDAHAAATAAERATHGIPFTVTRRPLTIGGAPAILLAPMPGQGPTVGIVLAHHGYLYWVIAFTNQDGDPLRPDQRQALASLRFIPHVGPFPTATVPPPNVPLPTPPSLSLAGAEGSRGAVTVRAWGTGYQPGEAVELQACWTGMPRPGLQLRYTWYWWAGVARHEPGAARHHADLSREPGSVHDLSPARGGHRRAYRMASGGGLHCASMVPRSVPGRQPSQHDPVLRCGDSAPGPAHRAGLFDPSVPAPAAPSHPRVLWRHAGYCLHPPADDQGETAVLSPPAGRRTGCAVVPGVLCWSLETSSGSRERTPCLLHLGRQAWGNGPVADRR